MTENVSSPEPIIAKPGAYYRNARYVIVTMALVAGLWSTYDGFINWPRYKKEFDSKAAEVQKNMDKPHSDVDIALQKIIAVALLAAVPGLLIFFLYRSRGAYRMTATMLYVPGHPPIPFGRIMSMDKSKWQRKGIAQISYQLPGSDKLAIATLDDFLYDQEPTDFMVDRIEKLLREDTAGPEMEASAQKAPEAR